MVDIADWNDLANISNDLTADYVLVNDIDKDSAGYSTHVDTSNGWSPLGGTFTGTLDGQGYAISDLAIYQGGSTSGTYAFFNTLGPDSIIKNLSFTNIDINGGKNTSFLAGEINDNTGGSLITLKNLSFEGNVSGTGSVSGITTYFDVDNIEVTFDSISISGKLETDNNSGSSYTGGLVGEYYAYNGGTHTVKDCTVEGEIIGPSAGGLFGYTYASNSSTMTIDNCHVDVRFNDVSSKLGFGGDGGGLIAYQQLHDTTITNCTTDGLFTNAGYGAPAGGFIGQVQTYEESNGITTIEDCVSHMDLYIYDDDDDPSISYNAGGFIGSTWGYEEIRRCGADGTITVDASGYNIGGFIGDWQAPTDHRDCYFDGTMNIQNKSTYNYSNIGGYAGMQNNYWGSDNNGEYYLVRAYASVDLEDDFADTGEGNLIGAIGDGSDASDHYIQGCYWYGGEAIGFQGSNAGTVDTSNSQELTKDQMTGSDAETNMTAFDFDSVWLTTANFPRFEISVSGVGEDSYYYNTYSTRTRSNTPGLTSDLESEGEFSTIPSWNTNDSTPFEAPIFGNNSIMLTNFSKYLGIIDKSNGSVIKDYDLSTELGYSASAIGGVYSNGVFYVRNNGAGLGIGIDQDTGEIIWDRRNPNGFPDSGSQLMPIIDPDNGNIITIGIESSSPSICYVWEITPGGKIVQSNSFNISNHYENWRTKFAYDPNRNILFTILDQFGNYLVIDRSDLSLISETSFSGNRDQFWAMDPASGDILGAGRSSNPKRYDPTNNNIVWETTIDSNYSFKYSTSVVDSNENVVIHPYNYQPADFGGSSTNYKIALIGFDISNGSIIFEWRTGLPSGGPNIAYDETTKSLVMPNDLNGNYYCVNPFEQKENWNASTLSSSISDTELDSTIDGSYMYYWGENSSGEYYLYRASTKQPLDLTIGPVGSDNDVWVSDITVGDLNMNLVLAGDFNPNATPYNTTVNLTDKVGKVGSDKPLWASEYKDAEGIVLLKSAPYFDVSITGTNE